MLLCMVAQWGRKSEGSGVLEKERECVKRCSVRILRVIRKEPGNERRDDTSDADIVLWRALYSARRRRYGGRSIPR